ncbi:hypothetical protein H2200_004923 [Cladophialophora chaetospira]|uniref:Short-chain dehydrogenase n=1 Tax=Cladophialophora chaetospira TaxID=386627 RepID=A0AA38XE82_9EURO|nr:hypothetical protein H2200_004923 [Cladophialophora chaetospira]
MSKILLILGAGPNIGSHVAKAFSSAGYKVAIASRTAPRPADGSDLHISVDLEKPDTVPAVFDKVRKEFGREPSVVVYNAAIFPPDPSDTLSLFTPSNISQYEKSQAVNSISVLVALHEATKSFRNAPADASKTFIFTGNALNVITLPGMLNFGLGKTVTAYAIRHLVEQKVYAGDGISIYYADERTAQGAPVGKSVSGPAAAEEYLKLAEQKEQGPWLYTFVKGDGYKDFEKGSKL